MARALALAARGRGSVEPNPMVGCVIVREGEVLGEGWHRRLGGPHAEREAIAAAERARADVRGATMYVTLEPCCHHGRTPPCTEAVLAAGIGRVVVAMVDPDEKVAGRGLRRLTDAGVEVSLGIRESQVRELLAPYVKLRTHQRPWVICKWAQTADGHLALPPGGERWITGETAREHVHRLRAVCQGILVGVETVRADDPLLTNRSGVGTQPVRVVLDSHLRIPPEAQLLRTAGESPVCIAAVDGAAGVGAIRAAGAEVLELPPSDGRVSLHALLDELGRREWTYLLVEGGAAVHRSFLDAGLADEVLAYVSNRTVGRTAQELPRLDLEQLAASPGVREDPPLRIGADTLRRLRL